MTETSAAGVVENKPAGLVNKFRPVGNLRRVFTTKDPELLVVGAAGTGKSRACLEKLHVMCLLNPGMRGLIARKTATSLGSTALVTFEKQVAAMHMEAREVRFFGGSSREAASYRYGNGARIVVGGMDKSTRIMSSEYDVVYVQEATELTEDDWEAVTTRLRNGIVSFQQLIGDCNPQQPSHWLHQRCLSGRTTEIVTKHEDNPRLYDNDTWTPVGKDYLAKLDSLTGVRKLRLRDGIWAAAEGLVYEEFRPDLHLSTRFNFKSHPPDDWPRYLAVDFGYTNPFCCQWWVEDPDGNLYLYREIYQTGRLVEDHARQILKLQKVSGRLEPMPVAIICDHDAEDRATLERYLEMPTTPAKKTVRDGIEAVQSRLRLDARGRPRLYICRDTLAERDASLAESGKPVCTKDEILEYVWDTRPQPGGGNTREAPVKANDHGVDALRYLCAYKDLQPQMRFRSFRV